MSVKCEFLLLNLIVLSASLLIFLLKTCNVRLMMLEEEQISFRSDSAMFDSIEDYSHQIAEMIGLRNESNFVRAGVSIF